MKDLPTYPFWGWKQEFVTLLLQNANKKEPCPHCWWACFHLRIAMWFMPRRGKTFMPECFQCRKHRNSVRSRQCSNSENYCTSVGRGDFCSFSNSYLTENNAMAAATPLENNGFAQVTRSKILPQRFPHSVPSLMESFLVWDMHKGSSTNIPSRFATKEVCLKNSKSAE